MGPSWHTGLVYWSITWPLQMCAVLHARNWHIKNHRHPPNILKTFVSPKTTTEDYLKQAIGDMVCNYEGPPEENSFLFLWWYNKKRNQPDFPHFAQKHISTTLTTFTITTNATTDSEWNLQLQNIPNIPVPSLRVERLLQPTRVQTHQSAPTTPPRLQPSTSPSLDPHPNPWNKKLKTIWSHPILPNPGKHKRHPGKFNTVYSSPCATLEKISVHKQHRILSPTIYSTYNMLSKSTIFREKGDYWHLIIGKG